MNRRKKAGPPFRVFITGILCCVVVLCGFFYFQSTVLSEQVKKGTVPHYLQTDKRWAEVAYGDSTIAKSGCGPTCLAMVYACLTGDPSQDPQAVSAFSEQNGYYQQGTGTMWTLMTNGAASLGLSSWEVPLDENRMKQELQDGHPLILSVGPGDFTTEGHFIVLSGVDGKGNFIIRDPNSRDTTRKTWSMERLKPQILNIWAFSST